MKKVVISLVLVLFLAGTAFANSGNHYGWYKCGPASNISSTWIAQSQSQSFNPTFKPTFNPTVNVSGGSFNPTFNPSVISNPASSASATVEKGAVTVNTGGGSGGGGFSGYLIQNFPEPYVTVPAHPLTYQGPFDSSIYADDQIWFNKPKWTKDMIDNLPNGGKVTEAIYEKTKPVNYIQPREGTEFDKSKYYYLGNVYCKSSGPDDNPGTVWGGCARKLLDKGCTYAYKIAGAITYGARSKATNQSGGASLAGIFGQIFGFNAGAGASNTDHDASGYEIINLTWACVGVQD